MRSIGIHNRITTIDLTGMAVSKIQFRESQFNNIIKTIREVYTKM